MTVGELIDFNIGAKLRKITDVDVKAKKENNLY